MTRVAIYFILKTLNSQFLLLRTTVFREIQCRITEQHWRQYNRRQKYSRPEINIFSKFQAITSV